MVNTVNNTVLHTKLSVQSCGFVLQDVRYDLHILRFPGRADMPDIQISLLLLLLQYPLDLFLVLTD